jgi:hypothetical protein
MRIVAIGIAGLILAFYCVTILFGQTANLKVSSPASVSITAEQSSELRVLDADFRTAQAQAEVARLRAENAQLKYLIAINGFRRSLGLTEDYEFDQSKGAFQRVVKEAIESNR